MYRVATAHFPALQDHGQSPGPLQWSATPAWWLWVAWLADSRGHPPRHTWPVATAGRLVAEELQPGDRALPSEVAQSRGCIFFFLCAIA